MSKQAATTPLDRIPKSPARRRRRPWTRKPQRHQLGSLTAHYNEQQILDIIFTAGNYALLAMALNTLGVEVDDGV